jgi:hypothetical protein
MKGKGPRFVAVTWEDSWGDTAGDATPENVHEKHHPAIMQTVGWLLLENEIGTSIFCERDTQDGSYRGRTFIPKKMILVMEDFPPKRARKRIEPKKIPQEV